MINSRATRKSCLEVSVYSSRSAINLAVLQSEYLPTESIDIDEELLVKRDLAAVEQWSFLKLGTIIRAKDET
jgi:hypothetical protein